MRVRWVIAGMFAIVGGVWLVAATLFALDVDGAWWPYAVGPIAAFVVGALMVAHAPLRPWREPVAAVALAIATVALGIVLEGAGRPGFWPARLLQPWYAGLGIAALCGVMAAAGGLAVRRSAGTTSRPHLVVVLSAFVSTGTTGVMGLVIHTRAGWVLALLGGVAAGGFITQAVIAARRPWACGAGNGAVAVLLALFSWERGGELPNMTAFIDILVSILLGYAGARLAWWILRRRDAALEPEVPSARLGRG